MPSGETGAEAPEPVEEEVQVAEEKPKWLPDKFNSPEDMAKAYHELERKLYSNSESVTDNDEGTPPPQTPKLDLNVAEARKTLSDQGLDYNKYYNETIDFQTTNKLDETRLSMVYINFRNIKF